MMTLGMTCRPSIRADQKGRKTQKLWVRGVILGEDSYSSSFLVIPIRRRSQGWLEMVL